MCYTTFLNPKYADIARKLSAYVVRIQDYGVLFLQAEYTAGRALIAYSLTGQSPELSENGFLVFSGGEFEITLTSNFDDHDSE